MACAYTSMDYYRSIPETTNRIELIDNVLHEPPAPYFSHQNVVIQIAHQLMNYTGRNFGKGTVIATPYDIYLDDVANAVQPDVALILPENPGIIDGPFHGVPDFVVEVLSPGNRKHDQKTKFELYERFGVKEYWIVDPNTQMVHGYSLVHRRFKPFPPQKGKIKSRLLNLTITL